jgi:tetratricopeptide (TPR) repeat protein
MMAHRQEFNFEKESLFASGVRSAEGLVHSVRKLDEIYQQFIHSVMPPSDSLSKAQVLFKWLWTKKPARFKPDGYFRLNDVIDAQLSEDSQTVGNCLGLTLLYHCLLHKTGITAEALYLENAFGTNSHVLTLLQTRDSLIDVENIFPDGFDYKGHLNNPSRTTWGDQELVADIYQSLGTEFFSKGDLIKALENYDMALRLNPNYEKGYLNKAILLDRMEMNGKMS